MNVKNTKFPSCLCFVKVKIGSYHNFFRTNFWCVCGTENWFAWDNITFRCIFHWLLCILFNCLSKRWGFLNIIRSTQIVFMFIIWKKWNTVWRSGHRFDYTKLWNILKSSVLYHTNKCNRNIWPIVTSLDLVRNIRRRVKTEYMLLL